MFAEGGEFVAAKIVAGGEEVGGVEADAEAILRFCFFDDGGEMLELVAEGGALAGGDFQASDYTVRRDALVDDV